MLRVLCFGDSLTYGQVPGTSGSETQRYDEGARWTSRLQALLGDGVLVIEEGLPSRTIDLDYPAPGKEGRNGSAYLYPCIESHLPLDVIILWLGTNDAKVVFERLPEMIADSMRTVVRRVKEIAQQRCSDTKVLLVAPPPIDESNDYCKETFAGATEKLEKLCKLYNDLANEEGLYFVDLFSKLDKPDSVDGVHLTPSQNEQVTHIFYRVVTEIMK